METTSWLFREDLSWNALAKFLSNHFKKEKKVQILNFGCADGSETYSLIMALKEAKIKDTDKFFPIKAFDIDEEIIKAAKSKKILTTEKDRNKILDNTHDWRKYLKKSDTELKIPNNVALYDDIRTFEVKEELTKAVEFNTGDMFKILKNIKNGTNTVLLCRNILGHFPEHKVQEFVKLANKKLKNRSILCIGDFDRKNSQIVNTLKENNFRELIHNVFIKNDTPEINTNMFIYTKTNFRTLDF